MREPPISMHFERTRRVLMKAAVTLSTNSCFVHYCSCITKTPIHFTSKSLITTDGSSTRYFVPCSVAFFSIQNLPVEFRNGVLTNAIQNRQLEKNFYSHSTHNAYISVEPSPAPNTNETAKGPIRLASLLYQLHKRWRNGRKSRVQSRELRSLNGYDDQGF